MLPNNEQRPGALMITYTFWQLLTLSCSQYVVSFVLISCGHREWREECCLLAATKWHLETFGQWCCGQTSEYWFSQKNFIWPEYSLTCGLLHHPRGEMYIGRLELSMGLREISQCLVKSLLPVENTYYSILVLSQWIIKNLLKYHAKWTFKS